MHKPVRIQKQSIRHYRLLGALLITVMAVFLIASAAFASSALDDSVLSLQELLDKLANTHTAENDETISGQDGDVSQKPVYLVLENEDTGYSAVILDQADLLSDEEKASVIQEMMNVTQFCNAICFTNTDSYSGSEIMYGGKKMEDICAELGLDSYTAVLFMIDMYNRKVTICPSVNVFNTITSDISNTITDNIYTYASRGDYAGTVRETFLQMYKVFDGQQIAQPMRYITAALLAVFVGLAISLILVRIKTKREKVRFSAIVNSLSVNECEPNVTVTLVSTKKVRHVESSGGGGGGGFSGGGGGGFSGGGGGGFSGGGGSHSF